MEVGSVVTSRAGRDAGKTFAVLQVLDENYVLIANGRQHKVEKPKKKKVRHLTFEGTVLSFDGMPANRELYALLREAKKDEE